MAVPKSKISKSKGRSRIANWKANAPTVVDCPQCHQPKVAHSVAQNVVIMMDRKK